MRHSLANQTAAMKGLFDVRVPESIEGTGVETGKYFSGGQPDEWQKP